MKLRQLVLAIISAATVAGVAYVDQSAEPAGAKMAVAAEKLLGTLTDEQKKAAIFDFDDKERLNWHFVPLQKDKKPTRKGVGLTGMTKEQREAALELLKAGTSTDGFTKASTIISLESILRELEKGGKIIRDPEWYFFAVFGKPSKTETEKWGWRVEGHHLSLNFVVEGGKITASTPAFFGANPAEVKTGEKKGLRTLAETVDPARELVGSFDDDQKKAAQQDKHFEEVQGKTPAPKPGDAKGLAAEKMTEKQRGLLTKLLEAYVNRMPAEVAQAELKQLKDAGIGKIVFGYSGSVEPDKAFTYRVHGPTFLIECLNIQGDSAGNKANHVHSVWRKPQGDFGVPATK